MNLVQMNTHALEDAVRLVAGTVGAQLIDATYKAIDAAEQRGFAEGQLDVLNGGMDGKLQRAFDQGRELEDDAAWEEGFADGFAEGFEAADETYNVDADETMQDRAASDFFQDALEMACAELDKEMDRPQHNDDLLDDTHYDIYHQRFHRPGDDT